MDGYEHMNPDLVNQITDALRPHVEFLRYCPCREWMDSGPGEDRVKHNYAEHLAEAVADVVSRHES